MANAQQQYTREIHDSLQYFATWLPIKTVAVGDIGVLRKGAFEKVATLGSRRISFDVEPDKPMGTMRYSSEGNVSVEVKAAGSAGPGGVPLATAAVEVAFGAKNAVLFDAAGCRSASLADVEQVSDAILKRFAEGKWEEEMVVVSEVVSAEAATIIISNSKNAKVSLSTNTTGPIKSLADASAGFAVTISKSLAVTIVAEAGLTPLFRMLKVSTGFLGFGETEFKPVKGLIAKGIAGPKGKRARSRSVGPVGVDALLGRSSRRG